MDIKIDISMNIFILIFTIYHQPYQIRYNHFLFTYSKMKA